MQGHGEITPGLHEPADHPDDLGLLLSTHSLGSQPSITAGREDPKPSSQLHKHWACTCYTDTYVGKTLTHMKSNK